VNSEQKTGTDNPEQKNRNRKTGTDNPEQVLEQNKDWNVEQLCRNHLK
jgi:hypothetical protein